MREIKRNQVTEQFGKILLMEVQDPVEAYKGLLTKCGG